MATDLAAIVRGTVTWDPDPDASHPSAWRTFRRCLETRPDDATHVCVIQDDVRPVRDFRPVLERAVAARPGWLIALFVGASPRHHSQALHEAGSRGEEWARLENAHWFPVVGSVWPVEFIPRLLAYVDAQNWPPKFTADDEIVGRWMRDAHLTGLATVPCLVEHPDEVPSLTGLRAWGGIDPNRVSTCRAPEDCDLLSCDWQQGPG